MNVVNILNQSKNAINRGSWTRDNYPGKTAASSHFLVYYNRAICQVSPARSRLHDIMHQGSSVGNYQC